MNERMNFVNAIENKTRIFSTISIQFLVFCGVSMEAAWWIIRCKLNKIKTVGN